MKKSKLTSVGNNHLLALLIVLLIVGCNNNDEKKIADIISTMSLEQKTQLVIGTSVQRQRRGADQADESAEEPSEYAVMAERVSGYVQGAAGRTAEFPEIGVTSQVLADGPAGLRISPQRQGDDNTYYCTAFPIATLLASTWDTDLVQAVGKSIGEEVLEYGADVLLAPALNLQRDPLCGRNFEYYSEDPLVTGKMAAAMVKGVQANGVGTSIKHFVANNQETNRMSVDAIVSERALRELYLKGFEIAVKEGEPWTVMSSYNRLNGLYTSENPELLTTILRDDWGYEGYVMTDWGGGSDVVAQMKAGNDLIMPGSMAQIETLENAVKSGELDEEILDRNISRILKIMLKSPRYNGYEFSNNPDLVANAQVTRKAATDGMVLLKNEDNALPLNTGIKNIAAFGNTSYSFISGGTGSGDVNEAYTISLIQGIANGGYETNVNLSSIYKNYFVEDSIRQAEERARQAQGGRQNNFSMWGRGTSTPAEMKVSADMAAQIASQSDVALITIGRNSGEFSDRQAIEGDFYLTTDEKEMIKNVSEAFQAEGKKTIVILNIGGVIETASWREYPDAILCAWQPGQEGGNSVVDVISGKVNPSGKLAVSFPMSYNETPTSMNFPGHAIETEDSAEEDAQSGFSFNRRTPWQVEYEEDIYVGYRYYNTFDIPVAYEFGYGLSYTNFEFSNLEIDSKEFDGEVNITVDVRNTGDVAGREVIQIYVTKPDGKLEKPAVELIAFDKTKLLNPGESETVSFTIETKDLSSFDAESSSWLAENGTYTFKVGSSSKNIILQDNIEVAEDLIAGKVNKALAPVQEMELLSK